METDCFVVENKHARPVSLECGVDVNKVNSYDQTALDIVNKFTTCKASKEIKQLLKDASFCVQAKAIQDHCNIYNPHSLTFKEGDFIKIVEQHHDGMWKGFLMKDGCMAKPGWFPADHVVLFDNSDENPREVTVLPPPPAPSYQNGLQNHSQNGKVIVNKVGEHFYTGSVESAYQNSCHIRSSSPVDSNRNSAASSDSGRGLSASYLDPKGHHNYVNVQVSNQYRLSGTSYESGVSSRQSYHSTSSSSVGSLDRLEESGYSSQINVAELFQAGVPDLEVLRAWLRDLNYEEYYQNFVQAGYDMPTITHMTPQDLTAIGISKPGHRKKLKAEISRLNIHDGIPDFKPNDLYDWLRMLNLEQYYNTLANQGYDNFDYITDITWEDLEEIGIQRLGHQKKIMLAIDRLKRILGRSKRLSAMDGQSRDATEVLEPPTANMPWSGDRPSSPLSAPPQCNEFSQYLIPRRSSSGDSLSTSSSGDTKSGNQLLESEYANMSSAVQQRPPSVVPIKVKRSMSQSVPNSMMEVPEEVTRQKMCQSFHAPTDRTSDYSDRENTPTGDDLRQLSRSPIGGIAFTHMVATKPKPVAHIVAKTKQSSRESSPSIIDVEKHEAERNNDGYKSPVNNLEGFKYPLTSNENLKKRTLENIYDTPQLGPPRSVVNYVNYHPMAVQQIMSSPSSPLHVSTQFSYTSGSPRGLQQNSPGGKSKKPPPPPPKRTASITTAENVNKNGSSVMGLNTMASSGPLTPVLSPPPIYQKSPMVLPHSQAFVNCVQSLSERFGKKSEENSAGDNVSSDSEELPPAPLVAMEIIEPKISNYGLLGKSDKTSSGEYMLQQRLKRENLSANSGSPSVESAFGVKLRQATESQNQPNEPVVLENQSNLVSDNLSQINDVQDGKNVANSQSDVQNNVEKSVPLNIQTVCAKSIKESSVVRKETDKLQENPTESAKGNGLSSSTSSLDSNTLPFANENVGTIKQRIQQVKPSLVMILDDGASIGPVHNSDNNVFSCENMDTIKKIPNKFPRPQQPVVQILQQKNSLQQLATQYQFQKQQQDLQPHTTSLTAYYAPGAQQPLPEAAQQKSGLKPAISPKPQPKGENGANTNQQSGDVLSEIDNMLQGLNDELDAMLESELAE